MIRNGKKYISLDEAKKKSHQRTLQDAEEFIQLLLKRQTTNNNLTNKHYA